MNLREQLTAIKAENARLLSALDDAVGVWSERECPYAPEDPEVEALWQKWAYYGVVLSRASELWRQKDPSEAHAVTCCRYAAIRARKVLDEIAPADPNNPIAPRKRR